MATEGGQIVKPNGKLTHLKHPLERHRKFGAGEGGRGGAAKSGVLAAKSIDEWSNAGRVLDPAGKSGQLPLAGRVLQKHGSQVGSAFPSVKGSPSEINAHGQKIADDILSNRASIVNFKDTGRFGRVMDVVAPDGRGVRYDASRKSIRLLEPSKS